MTGLAVAGALALLAIAAGELAAALWYWRLVRREESVAEPQAWPRVALLLTFRGEDPSLRAMLSSLLNQDYPDYRVHILLDTEADPARAAVEEVLRGPGGEKASVGVCRPGTANSTRLCAAMSQMLEALDDSVDVVAFTDPDARPDSGWLRRLVAPLADESLGVVAGHTWYEPTVGRLGSLLRSAWYGGGLVIGTARGYPSGCCMAFRLAVARRARLAERWARAGAHDGALWGALRELGLATRVRAELTVINREECSPAFAFGYTRRTLMWSGHYFGDFAASTALGLLSVGLLGLEAGLVVAGLGAGAPAAAAIGALALAGFHLHRALAHLLLREAVGTVARRRGEAWPRPSGTRLLRLLGAVMLAIPMHAAAALRARFDRRITWRQVVYEVRGPYSVKVISAAPFVAPRATDSRESL